MPDDPHLPSVELAPPEEFDSNYPRSSDVLVNEDFGGVPSPYAGQHISVFRHLKISSYWFATNFLWGALLAIMLPAEVKHLAPHLRVPALGMLTGVSAIFALFVPLVAGALSDRCASRLGRRRPFIASGVAINLVGLILMAWAYQSATPIAARVGEHPGFFQTLSILFSNQGYLVFLCAYIVVQVGNNIATAAYSGFIPDLIPANQRGAASGYMALMSQLGTLLGVVACALLFGGQPEPLKYGVLSAVLALIGILTVLGVRETPLPAKPPPINWISYAKSLWIDPREHPDFAWVWVTRFLVMLGFYAVQPFINYYLTDVIGIEHPEQSAAYVMAIILLASTFSGIYGGYLSDRVGRKKVVYLANTIIAVMVLGFIVCRTLPMVLVVGLLFGVGYGAYISVDWALGTDVLPSKLDAAKEMAVWHIAMTLPQSIAMPMAAALIASFGIREIHTGDEILYHYTVSGYAAVFVVCAICFGAGAYFLKNVKSVS